MKQRPARHDKYTKIQSLHALRVEKMKLRELLIKQELVIKDDFQSVLNKFSFLSVIGSILRTVVESFTLFNGLKMGTKLFSMLFHAKKKKQHE